MEHKDSTPPIDVNVIPEKRTYRTPEFITHGVVEDVTLGAAGPDWDGLGYYSVL